MAALVAPVLAHAGHVIEGIAFAGPAIVLPVALAIMVARDRRRERREGGD
jgi:hypothetical protein